MIFGSSRGTMCAKALEMLTLCSAASLESCQPHSLAGRRKASCDERDLWPEFARVIRETEPRWVVGENVVGLLSSDANRFFGSVLRDLAQMGCSVGWGVWGACDVGAPHRRDRVFIVAHHDSERRGPWWAEGPVWEWNAETGGGCVNVADAGGNGFGTRVLPRPGEAVGPPERRASVPSLRSGEVSKIMGDTESGQGRRPVRSKFQSDAGTTGAMGDAGCKGQGSTDNGRCAQSGMGGAADGVSAGIHSHKWPAGRGQEQYPWEPSRLVPSKSVRNRSARLKMLGNAVVPQQAYPLFAAIVEAENENR